MKRKVLYTFLFLLFSIFLYSQVLVIDERDIASLIPENFVKNFDIPTAIQFDKRSAERWESMSEEERATRYTYEIYDVYIKDIPNKTKQGFFGSTLLSQRDASYGYKRRLADPYNEKGRISRDEIAAILLTAKKDEYVLFDDRKGLMLQTEFLKYKKIQSRGQIVGETAIGFLLREELLYYPVYWIECAFLNGEDRITFIKLYCYDVICEMITYLPECFREVPHLNSWALNSRSGEEQVRNHIENRSKRLPPWMLAFLDYYDKLYISVQNLFDMQLPLDKTVFYATDNLNIRESSSLSGKKLYTAKKDSALNIIEGGRKETIDGITAPWIKVRLRDGTEGWCFAGYVAARKP